jgi:hypothetical protein
VTTAFTALKPGQQRSAISLPPGAQKPPVPVSKKSATPARLARASALAAFIHSRIRQHWTAASVLFPDEDPQLRPRVRAVLDALAKVTKASRQHFVHRMENAFQRDEIAPAIMH